MTCVLDLGTFDSGMTYPQNLDFLDSHIHSPSPLLRMHIWTLQSGHVARNCVAIFVSPVSLKTIFIV